MIRLKHIKLNKIVSDQGKRYRKVKRVHLTILRVFFSENYGYLHLYFI